MSRTLIIGHSHVECVKKAIQATHCDQVSAINIRRISNSDSPQLIIKEIRKTVKDLTPDSICLCIGGNEHNILTIMEHPIPFSVGDRESGQLPTVKDKDRWFIPYHVMLDNMRHKVNRHLPLATAIYEEFPGSARFHFPPPPPIANWEHIKNNPGMFGEKLHLGGGNNEIKRAVYEIQLNAFDELYQGLSAKRIYIPQTLTSEDGFLLEEYYSDNPTHGNKAYGSVMLEAIVKQTKEIK